MSTALQVLVWACVATWVYAALRLTEDISEANPRLWPYVVAAVAMVVVVIVVAVVVAVAG